jgi:hypothetical protein
VAKCEPGTRVIAIAEGDKQVVKIFGRGTYKGDEVPPADIVGPFGIHPGAVGVTNPRIDLDNGSTVWGCQCWWGPEDVVLKEIGDREIKEVSLDEYTQSNAV